MHHDRADAEVRLGSGDRPGRRPHASEAGRHRDRLWRADRGAPRQTGEPLLIEHVGDVSHLALDADDQDAITDLAADSHERTLARSGFAEHLDRAGSPVARDAERLGRVVEAAYFRAPAKDLAGVREAPAEMLLPTWLLAAATVWFGIDTSLTAGMASRAAETLIGGFQ